MGKFKVGDRVKTVRKIRHININKDSIGTVVRIYNNSVLNIGVEFDEFIDGHDCGGRAKNGYGWNLDEESLNLINENQCCGGCSESYDMLNNQTNMEELKIGDIVEIRFNKEIESLDRSVIGKRGKIIKIENRRKIDENGVYKNFYKLDGIDKWMFEIEDLELISRPKTIKNYADIEGLTVIENYPAVIAMYNDPRYSKSFKGIAKCDLTCDKFDSKIGIEIAIKRAFIKAMKYDIQIISR